jgi:pSer/pThr/pTyr-binding forkhead associated (FHA) protein
LLVRLAAGGVGPESTPREHTFATFPVRLGRNPLNDLVLTHQTVSGWHASIDQVEGRLVIEDLGTTNGVLVNGARLRAPGPLGDGDVVEIWPYEVLVNVAWREAAPVAAADDTVEVDVRGGLAGDGAGAPSSGIGAVPPPLPHTPGSGETDAGAAAAADHGTSRIDRDAAAVLQEVIGRLLPGVRPLRPGDQAALIERLLDVCRLFARSSLGLLEGQKVFAKSLGLRPPRAEIPHPATRDPAAFLAFLLDVDQTPERTVGALDKALTGILIHQNAVPKALMDGVQGLLRQLGPQAIAGRRGRASEGGALRRLLPGSSSEAALWRDYVDVHAELVEDPRRVYATIFGPEAAASYDSVLGERHAPVFALEYVDPEAGARRAVTAGGEEVLVGRARDVQVRIDHRSVSRHHFRIRWTGDYHLLIPARRSMENTRLNGEPLLGEEELFHGDVIRAGVVDVTYRFEQGRELSR